MSGGWGGGSGPGSGDAPDNATYVTLSTNTTLTNERVLTAGLGITVTDAGAGSTVIIAAPATAAQYVTLAATSDLANERVLTAGAGVTLTDAGAGSTITVAVPSVSATYVTLSNTGDLANERVLTAGVGTRVVDAGAGSTITIQIDIPFIAQGRLTTESGVPVSTSDRTAQGTIYFTPYLGSRISLYDGTNWALYAFTECSLALTVTSGQNYDVFLYNNAGTLTLELSAGWTNDTTRADALALQDGVFVKSGATTRRHVGTIRASAANVTEDSLHKRFVWNRNNQVNRPMAAYEATATWTYTTATWREANGSTTNQIEWVTGDASTIAAANLMSRSSNTSGNIQRSTGIGVDSTSAIGASGALASRTGAASGILQCDYASYLGTPGLGYHFLAWLEYSEATGTVTWQGDANTAVARSGIIGRVIA